MRTRRGPRQAQGGSAALLLAADGACPCECAKNYPQYFPSGHAYVAADPDIFPDPVPNIEKYTEFAVEDHLIVPDDIPAGDYVLGWRWDCEQTTQVWSTCADITIA